MPHNFGVFRDEETALSFIVERLVSAHKPEAVYLFGSRAEGRARPDSDFDILLVLPDGAGPDGDNYDKAYAPLVDSLIGADVVPCLLSDFRHLQDTPGTLCYAAKRGRLVYSR